MGDEPRQLPNGLRNGVSNTELLSLPPSTIFQMGMEYAFIQLDILRMQVAKRYLVHTANLERCMAMLQAAGYGGRFKPTLGAHSELLIEQRPQEFPIPPGGNR